MCASVTCTVCQKMAYAAEQISLDALVIHKSCFRCYSCKITLNRSNFFKKNGMVFCKTHFAESEPQARYGSGSVVASSSFSAPVRSVSPVVAAVAPSASQLLRDKGNEMLSRYQESSDAQGLVYLGQAKDLYEKALKAADTDDDKSSAAYNLCLVLRVSSSVFFEKGNEDAACESAREAINLADQAFESGHAVKPAAWAKKVRDSSLVFSQALADEHRGILHRMCPLRPTCFAEPALRSAADKLFKVAIVRMELRQAESEKVDVVDGERVRPVDPAQQAYLDELEESGFDHFDRRTESILEDANRFAAVGLQCIAKEASLSAAFDTKLTLLFQQREISELCDDIMTQKNICEARRALYRALYLKSQAIESQESILMDVVYLALDAFKFAVTSAEISKDIETEAAALAQLALMYQKVLQMEVNAKRYAKQVVSMAQSMAPRVVTNTDWYKTAVNVLRDYQMRFMRMDEEAKRKLFDKYKTDVLAARTALEALKNDPAELLKKVYEKYPPPQGTLDQTKLVGLDCRKTFQIAVTHFHPDKHLAADEKTYVVFSEIAKIMNSVWMEKYACDGNGA